jgi:hypothetical protein
MAKPAKARAKATLTIANWDEAPYQEWDNGAKLDRAKVTGAFSGDIEGDGSSEMLMAYSSAQSASFTGLQVVDGKLGGRTGRFVLQMTGTFEAGTAKVSWSVVPGSATGDLVGLSGSGGYVAGPGDFPTIPVNLDYSLA